MGKVFRLFEGSVVTHWQSRAGDYNNNVIKEIQGADGDKSKTLPTSIPSPFARLDLFKSAFASFENPALSLDGDTNNHRIVSECLDLLELLYNYDNLGDRKIRIVSWDKQADLPLLANSNSAGHKLLANTLGLYLTQDQEAFSFDIFNRFYIIYLDDYVLGNIPEYIGFTTANPKDFAQKAFGEDTLFANIIKPLYKRDKEFVKYLISFFEANVLLKERMSDLFAYIRKNKNKIQQTDRELYDEITEINVNDLNDYSVIEYDTLTLEVFGIPLRKIKKQSILERIAEESQFLIHTDKKIEGNIPMVLATNGNLGHLNYLNATTKWDINQKVDRTDVPINQRVLPGKDIKYPYYTIDDFLTNELYETPYSINKDYFFDGNYDNQTGDNNVGYLLPLKSLFFEYFNESSLWSNRYNGKPMLEIVRRNSFVTVFLRVPINKGKDFIELTKKYERSEIKTNYGKLVSCKKYVQFFPFQKSNTQPNYYVNLLDTEENDVHQDLRVQFDGKEADFHSLKSKYGIAGSYNNSHFYRIKRNFSLIEIKQAESEEGNYLIPKWQDKNEVDSQFTFSIDFGTSNTHIEYAVNEMNVKPLDFKSDRNGMAQSFDLESIAGEEKFLFDMEFIPYQIENNSEYSFPIRTVLFDYHNYQSTSYQPLLDYNIGFIFEKKQLSPFNRSRAFTNLKWINNSAVNKAEQEAQVNSFLEQLIIMCKTKVLIEGGNISLTKFVWTYPLSYGTKQILNVSDKLKAMIKEHFGEHVSIEDVCESIAPFYAISKEGKLLGTSNHILSLDIGGGTIDSVVYQRKRIKSVSSMLFGANFLYANGYETSIEGNAFYKVGNDFVNELPENLSQTIRQIKEDVRKTGKIEDLISFYFSLEKHQDFKGKKNVSFSEVLAGNSSVRPVFLFYYAAIIYYNVRAMKASGHEKPTKLIFSGNGSRFLSILDKSSKNRILAEYTDFLIDGIYGIEEDKSQIEIITYPNPKELTSRGAVSILSETGETLEELSVRNIKKCYNTYLGDTDDTVVSEQNPFQYQSLDERFNEPVYEEYLNFVHLFLEQRGVNLRDLFDITIDLKTTFEQILTNKRKAIEYLEAGIELRCKQVTVVEDISDPFFFYIIRGMLSDMLRKLMPDEN